MRAAPDKTAFNIRRLTAILVCGTVLIVGACVGAILWVLAISSTSVDRAAENGAHKLLDSVIDTYQSNISKSVADYAAWDDLHDNFAGRRRAKWEADNLGRNITKNFGVDFVAVVSRDGSILYSYHSDDSDPLPLSAADAHILADLARMAANARPREYGAAVSGAVPFEGAVGLVSASPLLTSKAKNGGGHEFVLIELRDLRSHFLAKIGKDFGIAGLKAVHAPRAGLPLLDPQDKPSGFSLTWTPTNEGQHLFSRVLPAILWMGLVLLAVFLGLMTFWWKIVEHIRSNDARTHNAEIDAVRARAASAEEMTKGKSAFIANMSHELRTPLNAIIGFSEIIQSEILGPIRVPKYVEYVNAINESGQHLLRIINDILLVSRVEAGKFTPHIEDVLCADVLNETIRMMEIVAEKKGITLKTSRCSCAAIVRVDKQALRQILLNVLSNAVKFSTEGSEVEVEADGIDANGRLEIRVIDHGCGIPKATLKDIGKPFVQAEDAYTRNFQGTGLGLAISFRLAGAMNATIKVSSIEGAGTTVTIGLKAASAVLPQAAVA